MKRIPALDNIIIEIESPRWRLLQNGSGAERVLVETAPGLPLSYPPTFGAVRRLPDVGTLNPTQVDRVVLGWSPKDQAWHLGLMLLPPLAEERGSRWCALATWNNDLPNGDAQQAGEELAQVINRPFVVIPPKESASPVTAVATSAPPTIIGMPAVAAPTVAAFPAVTTPDVVAQPEPIYAPPIAPPPLPELPYELDDWLLERMGTRQLALTLSGKWLRSRILKSVWYLFWAVIFLILAVTSLTSGIAPPQPHFLPYLGIAGAIFLFGLGVYTIVTAMRMIRHIEIDGEQGMVRGLKGSRDVWRISADQAQSVYISQIVSKVNERKMRQTVSYGELSLLLHDGTFEPLAYPIEMDEKIEAEIDSPTPAVEAWSGDSVPVLPLPPDPNMDDVVPLTPFNSKTKAQAAALQIANTLNLPAWYDRRVR
jgi:hypothetical protein